MKDVVQSARASAWLRVPGTVLRVSGPGISNFGFGFRLSGFGFRVLEFRFFRTLGFGPQLPGFRVSCVRFRRSPGPKTPGCGFQVSGIWYLVSGFVFGFRVSVPGSMVQSEGLDLLFSLHGDGCSYLFLGSSGILKN